MAQIFPILDSLLFSLPWNPTPASQGDHVLIPDFYAKEALIVLENSFNYTSVQITDDLDGEHVWDDVHPSSGSISTALSRPWGGGQFFYIFYLNWTLSLHAALNLLPLRSNLFGTGIFFFLMCWTMLVRRRHCHSCFVKVCISSMLFIPLLLINEYVFMVSPHKKQIGNQRILFLKQRIFTRKDSLLRTLNRNTHAPNLNLPTPHTPKSRNRKKFSVQRGDTEVFF